MIHVGMSAKIRRMHFRDRMSLREVASKLDGRAAARQLVGEVLGVVVRERQWTCSGKYRSVMLLPV